MYLRNPSGVITQVDEPLASELLKQEGFSLIKTYENEIVNKDLPRIYWQSGSNEADGYGQSQELIFNWFKRNGFDISRKYDGQAIGILYSYPYGLKELPTKIKILYSMFESTKIPDDWKEPLKLADLIIVPSQFCQKAFANSGFESEIVNLGYNSEEFFVDKEKKDDGIFRFGSYNYFNTRKGWDILWNAFTKEFDKTEPVKFVAKTTLRDNPFPISKNIYPNIEIIHGSLTLKELRNYIQDLDCFVFPSRGEGFGLTPLEALACGVPSIIPNGSGMSEYFNYDYFIDIPFKERPAIYEAFTSDDTGLMIEPDEDELRKKMRWAFSHKEELENMGKKGSEWVRKYSIENTVRKLKELILGKFDNKAVEIQNINDKDTDENSIVFITEDTQHITGGRYYSWWLATALKASGKDVVIYTNREPVFIREFQGYPQPKVKIVSDLSKVDTNGLMYFGSPIIGSEMAIKLGKKYNKPIYVEVFDPFPMMEKYRGAQNWKYWDWLIPAMKDPAVNIIGLCETTKPWIEDWLNAKGRVYTVNPCVNTMALRSARQEKKKDWITFISRLDNHKKLDHVLDAVKNTDCELHVITSVDGINFPQMIKDHGMEDRVVIHQFASDLEKFKIIKQSRAIINGAIFEGFGMWLAEALECGVPCVCYDYPTFREITEIAKAQEMVHFAKYNDPEDLKLKLKEALLSDKRKRTVAFDFDVMVKRFRDIFSPKIGVITIALNEEKFIEASLRSILKLKEVKKIVVVEGCVRLNESQADEYGLSKDKMSRKIFETMIDDNQGKIIYDRMGWAIDKAEMRNKALSYLKDMDYILVVDADEVWKKSDFDKVIKAIEENPNVSVFQFKTYHFWKQKDLIAVGSQWDKYLFRFFKFNDKQTHWERHEAPVVNSKGELLDKLGIITLDDVHFYHYGAMKGENDIKAKLEYYGKRDKDLDVKDTWSNWKKGQETQWTHGGGTVEKFKGTHPKEVVDII